MTKGKGKTEQIDVKELLERDEDFLQAALQALLQAALEAEMSETIRAEKGERTEMRLAYRSGYYARSLVTRVCRRPHAAGTDGADVKSAGTRVTNFLTGIKSRPVES
jgi:hypothetical protein